MSAPTGDRVGFQYVVWRCVPRVDREEFANVGVVVYCQDRDFLALGQHVDETRLRALAPGLDLGAVRSALAAADGVCRAEESAGAAGRAPLGVRFGFLSAPRSTVVQPGPIHGGLTADPRAELARLVATLVATDAG